MDAAGKGINVSHEKNILDYEDKRDKILLEPLLHVIRKATTNIWEEYADAFNYWLKVPDEAFKKVADNFRKFYYGDLLFENIRDNYESSECDQLSSISVYGLPCALNALFQIYILAAQELTRLNPSKGPNVYVQQVEDICIGRYMEQQWNDNVICPTEAEYYHMIVKQTSGHFGAQIKYLQLYSSNQNNFRKLLGIFGLFLRIREDYRYFISADGSESKLHLPDETLSNFSLPIIHAVTSDTEDGDAVMEILRRRTNMKDMKMFAASLLEKIGSLEYTRKILMKLREEALLEMGKFEKNPLLESIFDKYFNIPLPPNTEEIETSVDSIKDTIETLKISSYLNQMENVQSDEKAKKKLLQPFNHINSVPKRDYVMNVFRMLNESIMAPADKFAKMTVFVANFGYSVLMLDDIQDKSMLRKSVPCSYLIYGMMTTINSVLYMFSKGFQEVLELNVPEAVNLYFVYIPEMFRGQGMELYWRDNYVCPTEEEYMQMVSGKTGGPLGIILGIMQACGTSTMNIEKLPAAMATYFQVHDDYENLISQEYYDVKGFCEDITEGKFGFPTLHAITTHPEEAQTLIDILRQRTYDVDLKRKFLSILEKCGSFDYSRKKLKEFRKVFIDELAQFSRKNEVESFLRNKFHITLEDTPTEKQIFC